jgi:hypothetical protein
VPFKIIHDAEEGIAAIIDPVAGVALGPILSTAGDPTATPPVKPGERAKELLDIFASGLAAATAGDPAALNAITLARHFDAFIESIMEDVEPEVAGARTAMAVDAEQRGEPAGVGEQGGLAGPNSSGEVTRIEGAPADENADGSLVADAIGDSGVEQARPAADPSASSAPVSAENDRQPEPAPPAGGGPGVPKV